MVSHCILEYPHWITKESPFHFSSQSSMNLLHLFVYLLNMILLYEHFLFALLFLVASSFYFEFFHELFNAIFFFTPNILQLWNFSSMYVDFKFFWTLWGEWTPCMHHNLWKNTFKQNSILHFKKNCIM